MLSKGLGDLHAWAPAEIFVHVKGEEKSQTLFLMEIVVPRYLHCSTIGIFDLPRKKDGELTFNSFLLKHKENDLNPLYNS